MLRIPTPVFKTTLHIVSYNLPVSSVVEHMANGAEGLGFDSRAGQIGHCVVNGSEPLWRAVLLRRYGGRCASPLATRFGVTLLSQNENLIWMFVASTEYVAIYLYLKFSCLPPREIHIFQEFGNQGKCFQDTTEMTCNAVSRAASTVLWCHRILVSSHLLKTCIVTS